MAKIKLKTCDSDEVYTPEKNQSNQSQGEKDQPVYIPSRKDAIDRSSSCVTIPQHRRTRSAEYNDAKCALRRSDCRELISKYHCKKPAEAFSGYQDTFQQIKSSGLSKKSDKYQEVQTNFACGREVTGGNSSAGVKNFQITCISPSKLQSLSGCHYRKMHQHDPSPEPMQPLQVILSPSSKKESRISVTARLGKVVLERKGSPESGTVGKNYHSGVSYLTTDSELKTVKENIINKTGHSQIKERLGKYVNERVMYKLGQEAVSEQNSKAVILEQTAHVSKKSRHANRKHKMVHGDADSKISKEDSHGKNITSSRHQTVPAKKSRHSQKVSTVSARGHVHESNDSKSEDLEEMIDKELLSNLLGDIHHPKLTSTSSIDKMCQGFGDHAVETVSLEMKEKEKSAIRFIVTLDGVDEKHFGYGDQVIEKLKNPSTPAAPEVTSEFELIQQKHVLNLLTSQTRTESPALLQKVQTLAPKGIIHSELNPPEIHPFTVCLKDTDGEHNKRQGKMSTSRQGYQEEDNGISALKQARMSEKCKFWPACAAGGSCEYHHPTIHCKMFPNCKFGDKCLFIHPNCRFDSKCARSDCPYTHSSRRPAPARPAHIITIPQPHFVFSPSHHKPHFLKSTFSSSSTLCHYFPNCQNANCPFLHPKPCRFGVTCRSQTCPFYHQPAHVKDKLKWQSRGRQPEASVAALLASIKKESSGY